MSEQFSTREILAKQVVSVMKLWKDWWQDDLPCLFSPEQTKHNYEFLVTLLGEKWLEKSIRSPGVNNHQLLHQWTRVGGFFELNALSEDLRVVRDVSGLDEILKDLRNKDRCLPTWHVIHTAALLMRPESQNVTRFFPKADTISPDFVVSTRTGSFLVEGKLLLRSEQERRFERCAQQLCTTIHNRVLTDAHHPWLYVLIKSVDHFPGADLVVSVINSVLNQGVQIPALVRTTSFNICLEPPFDKQENMTGSKACFIIAHRPDKENLRFHDRVRKASSQILSSGFRDQPGLLCLGLGQHEDVRIVADQIDRRFRNGRYRGLSSILLSRRGDHVGRPKRTHIDAVGIVHNHTASLKLPSGLRLDSVGELVRIIDNSSEDDTVSVYKYGKVLGQAHTENGAFLAVPKFHRLNKELFH